MKKINNALHLHRLKPASSEEFQDLRGEGLGDIDKEVLNIHKFSPPKEDEKLLDDLSGKYKRLPSSR